MKIEDMIKNKKIISIEIEVEMLGGLWYKKFYNLKKFKEAMKMFTIYNEDFKKKENKYVLKTTAKDGVDVIFTIKINEQKLN